MDLAGFGGIERVGDDPFPGFRVRQAARLPAAGLVGQTVDAGVVVTTDPQVQRSLTDVEAGGGMPEGDSGKQQMRG